MKQQHIPLFLSGVVALMLAACAQTVNTQGQVILPSHLAAIQPGTSTKADVREQLGTPSATGTFSADRWYYISSQVQDKVLRPQILRKRQVVIVDFDANGIVSGLNQKTEADSKTVAPVAATTPTHNINTSFLSEFFGNLGMGLPGVSRSPGGTTTNPRY